MIKSSTAVELFRFRFQVTGDIALPKSQHFVLTETHGRRIIDRVFSSKLLWVIKLTETLWSRLPAAMRGCSMMLFGFLPGE